MLALEKHVCSQAYTSAVFYACPISTVVLVEFDTGEPFIDAITVNGKIYYTSPQRMNFFFFFP